MSLDKTAVYAGILNSEFPQPPCSSSLYFLFLTFNFYGPTDVTKPNWRVLQAIKVDSADDVKRRQWIEIDLFSL